MRCALALLFLASCTCQPEAPLVPSDTPDASVADAGVALDDAGTVVTPDSGPPPSPVLVLQLGADLGTTPAAKLDARISAASLLPVMKLGPDAPLPTLVPGSIVIALGNTTVTRALITQTAAPESFTLRSAEHDGVRTFAAAGTAGELGHGINRGALYGAYALLEEFGFAFLHPLAPIAPPSLALPGAPLDRTEAPHWRIRGWHLHTMHPLELTHVLEGWGPGGPEDESGWLALLPEWDSYLEWATANRQNRVEWVLLSAASWSQFADSPGRAARLKRLVDMAHAWGIAAGADAALALKQQNTWHLVRTTGSLASEKQQIRDRLDWLMPIGYDFFSTEMGFSEFTAPDSTRMLEWMNEATAYTADRYGAPTYVKIHVSQGQKAQGYPDPLDGGPINFNFLPHFADPRLGVMPHSVQLFGIDDPAPTYGNTSFQFMRDFLTYEAGRREVLWHPETAYWVSFDINVPLFLPLYGERRLHDLRVLGADEAAGRLGDAMHPNARIDGQMNFSSGWEYGYWLGDVMSARAAWNPDLALSDAAALEKHLQHITRAFGPAGDGVKAALTALIADQHALLIKGEVNGVAPTTLEKRNGIAYLEGWEALQDVATLLRTTSTFGHVSTQPDKLGLIDMRNPLHPPPGYSSEVEPLLAAMETRFGASATALEGLVAQAPPHARALLAELTMAARMTALRAKQVHGLYDYVDGIDFLGRSTRPQRLVDARNALDAAAVLVAARHDSERIDGWGVNPTAYRFGYLWTAKTLYFWWRDEGKAVDHPIDPCYLNILDPITVAFGEGLSDLAARVPSACLQPPLAEPIYPVDNLRLRQ